MNIKKILVAGVMLVGSLASAESKLEKGSYQIDPMHSKVGFEIAHLVISTVEGKFKVYSGSVEVAEKFEKSKVEAEADIGSIDTGVEKRDGHLKSADFFDAEKFPKMSFKSSEISGKPESFKMTGDLTIKGKTKKVTFDSKYLGSAVDGYGNLKAAFVAHTKISRKEFGLTWNQAVEVGPVVGDEVSIELKIQAGRPAAKK